MTDWHAANLAQRAAREAMDEQKRREAAAAQEAADREAFEQLDEDRSVEVDRALARAGLL